MTFGQCADALLASKASGWRNAKHRDQWKMTLNVYTAALRPIPITDVTTQDVLKTSGRIEEHRPNPARWSGHLEMLLPRPAKLARGHHTAMAYAEVPSFMRRLKGQDSVAALALRFLILTAARSGEVLGATWQEIDLDTKLWTVPAQRMKAGRDHRVPLSGPALAIIEKLKAAQAHGRLGRVLGVCAKQRDSNCGARIGPTNRMRKDRGHPTSRSHHRFPCVPPGVRGCARGE